jgi:hypothetical protein
MADPREIASDAAQHAWNRHYQGALDRKRKLGQKTADSSRATYGDYDADLETHQAQTDVGTKIVDVLLTNGGLATGDEIELVAGAADDIPRPRSSPQVDPVLGGTEPKAVALVKRRSLNRIETGYQSPHPAEYSEPVPAQWSLIYSAGNYIPDAWDRSQQKRYTPGGSNELCGSDYGDDYDTFCRTGFSTTSWANIPDANVLDFGYGGYRCHFSFLVFVDGFYQSYGGIVVGIITPSPDGIEAVPDTPLAPFPTVQYRIRNPASLFDPNVPRWLGCGEEKDMQWRLVEAIQVGGYTPPQIVIPAFPGGYQSTSYYQQEFWLVSSDAAPVKVFSLPDTLADGRGSKDITAWLALDEQGVTHVDFKIQGSPVQLKHFQVQGQTVTQVAQSASWRKALTNSPTNDPLPSVETTPCVALYQYFPTLNIASDYLYEVAFDPGNSLSWEKLTSEMGVALKIRSKPLQTTGSTCSTTLDSTAEEEVQVTLKIKPADISAANSDLEPPYVVSYVGVMT